MALQEPLSQAGFPGLDYMSPQGLDFVSPFPGQTNVDTWAPLGGLAAVTNLRIVPPMGYAWAGKQGLPGVGLWRRYAPFYPDSFLFDLVGIGSLAD